MNIKDDFILSQINEGYLVGGSVRDALMGKSFVDRDIAIKDAEAFAKKMAEKFNATFVVLDPEYKIYRLVLEDKINYHELLTFYFRHKIESTRCEISNGFLNQLI